MTTTMTTTSMTTTAAAAAATTTSFFLSERTLLERCCVHNMSPFISSSGLSPGSREAKVQRAKVCLNCTEPSVARSSCWSLPVGRYCQIHAARPRWWSSWGEQRRRLLVTRWESGEHHYRHLTLTLTLILILTLNWGFMSVRCFVWTPLPSHKHLALTPWDSCRTLPLPPREMWKLSLGLTSTLYIIRLGGNIRGILWGFAHPTTWLPGFCAKNQNSPLPILPPIKNNFRRKVGAL